MPNYSDSENEIIDRIARNPHPQRLPKNDDSSSSRESSPDSVRKQKRSFTPTSDDDLQISPIPDDDTPPPPEKPVLRQALGFASAFGGISTSATLNTYQAKPTNPGNAKFLPGQTVFPASTTKKVKASGTKTKKTKKKDYATQTGRFRLTDWTSSPNNASASESPPAPTSSSTQPPPPAMSNVYSLMNNNHNGNGYGSNSYSSSTQASQISTMYSVPPPPIINNTTPYFSNTQHVSTTFTPTSAPPASVTGRFSATKLSTDTQIGSSKGKLLEKAKATPSTVTAKVKQKDKPAANSSNRSIDSADNLSRSTTYYRRDYESQVDLDAMSTSGAGPSSPEIPSHLVPKGKSDHLSIKQSKPSRPASRMVTVLITDVRSGKEDHQLTEVIVPLKDTDPENPEYGFWANAQEVVGKLQSSPARIEGPARAYTMRGKYRQIFMRVVEDGTIEAVPVNISVSSERILEMVVEKLPSPGELPSPPRIPRDLRPSPDPDELSSYSHSHDSRDNKRDRKRYRSPSDGGDRLNGDYGSRSRSGSVSHQNKKRRKVDEEEVIEDSDADLFTTPLTGIGQEWNFDYESPTSDDDENLDAKIVERIDPALQMHPTPGLWESVFKIKARLPRVPAYVELYRILQAMFKRYEGRRVPFKRNRNIRIQKAHILKALRVLDQDDEHSDLSDPDKIYSNCVETLKLISLYGPEGTRLQDVRVQEMMKDESTPEKYSKPQKRFLRLLREIDEKWQAEHVGHVATNEQTKQAEVEAEKPSAQPSSQIPSAEGTVSTVTDRGSSATLDSN
ncbi:uncharacterized protein C8R40DRAFT_1107651 [Lentinula edodes]|nr:uncharacterized protein C8R40DRAFT_1107651 [Lentinula edodes]KAH7874704.1 hypothetical protein C8R40DRAFT_1107651 [Lentinula edodes]